MDNNIAGQNLSDSGQQTSGEGAQVKADPKEEAFRQDIDSIFGGPASDGSQDSGAGLGGVDPSQVKPSDRQEDYTGMSEAQLAKMFQSKYDKAQDSLNKVSQKAEHLSSLEDFFHNIYEDESVRRAFIAELEPDLITPKDPYDALEEQLKKEFGDDYVPDDDEAGKPLTKSWRYLKRVDELYKEQTSNKTNLPKSLKELRTDRKTAQEASKLKVAEDRQQVLSTMKWEAPQYNAFVEWAGKINPLDLAKIYSFAMRKQGGPPNLATQGGGQPFTPSQIQTELTSFFG